MVIRSHISNKNLICVYIVDITHTEAQVPTSKLFLHFLQVNTNVSTDMAARLSSKLDVKIISNANLCENITHPMYESLDSKNAKEFRAPAFRNAVSEARAAAMRERNIPGSWTCFMPFRFSVPGRMSANAMTNPNFLRERIAKYFRELHSTARDVFPELVKRRELFGSSSENIAVNVYGVMIEKYVPNERFSFHMLHIMTSVRIDPRHSIAYNAVKLLDKYHFGLFLRDEGYPVAGSYDHYDQVWHTLTCVRFDDFEKKFPEFYERVPSASRLANSNGNLLINVRVMSMARFGILYRNTKQDADNGSVLHIQTDIDITRSEKLLSEFVTAMRTVLGGKDIGVPHVYSLNDCASIDSRTGEVKFAA